MHLIRNTVCLLLALSILLSGSPALVSSASEDPMAVKDLSEFGAALPEETEKPDFEENLPVETEPVQTEAAETETVEEPTEETQPEETIAQEEKPKVWEPRGHNDIPLYFQTDYPDNMYGMGTIASSGCSAVCLSMVASYMTGHTYLPDEIARYFGGAAENNIARLELGSDTLQLPYHKAKDWHETHAALKEGKVAIALMNYKSIFTSSQHFIVLTGLTEDGKILVNDPYEPNYEKWDLKKGLEVGFDDSAIVQGYSGAWIYDKDAMPEDPFIYHVPKPVRGEPRYDFELTEAEMDLLAKVVWVEARGECMEGQQAVAEVIFNRMASESFSDKLEHVIYSAGQFVSSKFLEDAQPYQMQYEAIENALYGPYVLPMDVVYFATNAKTDNVWGEIGGHVFCYAED